jgi:hypothetical protein
MVRTGYFVANALAVTLFKMSLNHMKNSHGPCRRRLSEQRNFIGTTLAQDMINKTIEFGIIPNV